MSKKDDRPDVRTTLTSLRRTLGFVGPYLRPQRPLLAGGLLTLLLEVAFRLVEPWPLKVVIDAVVTPNATGGFSVVTLLIVAAIAVFLAAALRALMAYLTTVCFALAGTRAMTAVRSHIFAHVQRLSLRFHGRTKTGDLLTRLVGDVGRLQEVAVTAALPLIGNTIALLGMTAVMVVMDWRLALIALCVFPAFLYSGSEQSRKITSAARKQRKQEGDLAGTAGETLGAMKLVQAYSLERVLLGVFDRSNSKALRDSVKASRLAAGLERRTDLLIGFATGAVLLGGGSLAISGDLTPGELVVFVSYLKGAFKPMRDLAKYTGRLAKAAASGERIIDLLSTQPEVEDGPDARPAPRLTGDVHFEGVHVSYEPGTLALAGIDLHVRSGARVGLVGPSGSGKSTLASLLLRFHDPVAGRVMVDGYDLRDLTLQSVRSQVAVVLQETVLFATTVRENIRYGCPSANDEAIEAAARQANAHEFIARLPEGYDTVVGERGESLSGGQRQRIAIARAMLRDARVVILDEATTGLDAHNSRHVLEAMRRLTQGRTTFVISHEESDVADCDMVIRLDHGRIVRAERPQTRADDAPTLSMAPLC